MAAFGRGIPPAPIGPRPTRARKTACPVTGSVCRPHPSGRHGHCAPAAPHVHRRRRVGRLHWRCSPQRAWPTAATWGLRGIVEAAVAGRRPRAWRARPPRWREGRAGIAGPGRSRRRRPGHDVGQGRTRPRQRPTRTLTASLAAELDGAERPAPSASGEPTRHPRRGYPARLGGLHRPSSHPMPRRQRARRESNVTQRSREEGPPRWWVSVSQRDRDTMTATESGPVPAGTSALTVSGPGGGQPPVGSPRPTGCRVAATTRPWSAAPERQRELSRRLADRLPRWTSGCRAFSMTTWPACRTSPTCLAAPWPSTCPGWRGTLSLPVDTDHYASELITSYRLANGVLHNPRNDRRTTVGSSGLAEGGLPIPDDKLAVPRETFAFLPAPRYRPQSLCWSCRSRPRSRSGRRALSRCCCVRWSSSACRAGRGSGGWRPGSSCPAAWSPISTSRRRHLRQCRRSPMCRRTIRRSTRCTGPGIPAWSSSHPTWCQATKASFGPPHRDKATDRQIRDGMCWTDPAERYNGARLQGVRARRARRDRHDHRRQLLRLLQEGKSRRRSLYPPTFRRRGGGAPVARWCSRAGTRARSSSTRTPMTRPRSPRSSPAIRTCGARGGRVGAPAHPPGPGAGGGRRASGSPTGRSRGPTSRAWRNGFRSVRT